MTFLPTESVRHLDVRPMLARGEEPLATILTEAGSPPDGHALCLRAPFEPVPLYAVLAERGFSARSERLAADDWRVWFYREPPAPAEDASPPPAEASAAVGPQADGPPGDERCGGAFRERVSARNAGSPRSRPERPVAGEGAVQGPYLLDVRLLAGPAKHATIHECFDALGAGQALTIVNDHDPRPLYYELCAERPGRFDAAAYRAYPAAEDVWVAVLPVRPG